MVTQSRNSYISMITLTTILFSVMALTIVILSGFLLHILNLYQRTGICVATHRHTGKCTNHVIPGNRYCHEHNWILKANKEYHRAENKGHLKLAILLRESVANYFGDECQGHQKWIKLLQNKVNKKKIDYTHYMKKWCTLYGGNFDPKKGTITFTVGSKSSVTQLTRFAKVLGKDATTLRREAEFNV